MPRLILEPIGSPLGATDEAATAAVRAAEVRLRAARDEVRAGWGARYAEKVRSQGRLPVWERIELLLDPGTELRTLGTLVGYDRRFGPDERSAPGVGVVTGLGRVADRLVVVIANDNTVAAGAWWPQTPEKIQRAQSLALRLALPVVYLVDCSGLFLPEQAATFGGATGAGHIFQLSSRLSAAGVPQLAGVLGASIAGGGYMPIISDRVVMTEQSFMVIASDTLVQGATGRVVDSLAMGGADVHVHLSGCADERVPDDAACVARLRQTVAELPTSAASYYRYGVEPAPPAFDTGELEALVPADARVPYDVRQVIARLVDDSLFHEVFTRVGPEAVVGIGRIGGLFVGIVANEQRLVPVPGDPSQRRPGGILTRESIAKLSAFSRACDSDGIPLLWLQDVSGFDVGPEAERLGLLAFGSNLIYGNSTHQVPMVTVLLRKASGAAYYAMAGRPYEPVVQLGTALTRLGVMDGRTAALGATAHASEAADARRQAIAAQLDRDMDAIAAAARHDIDELVDLRDLRGWLETLLEACYQSTGVRRIKNPRIWSLHDLAALGLGEAP